MKSTFQLRTVCLSLTLAAVALIGVNEGRAAFNVRDYGAVGDGKTMETAAITKAIDACAAAGGGTVYFPPGKYLTGAIVLSSNMTLEVDSGATILGSENRDDYPLRDNPWIKGRKLVSSLIYAEDAENITICGSGTIDGQGRAWWQTIFDRHGKSDAKTAPDSKADSGKGNTLTVGAAADEASGLPPVPAYFQDVALRRPEIVRVVRCKNLTIQGLHFVNSPSWNLHPLLCERVRV